MSTFICHCEKEIDLGIDDVINLDEHPELIDQMKENKFLSITCPHCGSLVKPEITLRIQSATLGIDYFIIPELDRLSFYRNKVSVPQGCEVLIGFSELFERIRVIDAKLDVDAIEIIKYYLQCKAEDSDPEAEITIYFQKLENGTLNFYAYGFSNGQAAKVPVPLTTYEQVLRDCATTKKQQPFATIFSGKYRSIKKLAYTDDED